MWLEGSGMNILVTDLLDLKKTTQCPYIAFLQVFYTVNNCGTNCTGDAIIVSLSNPAESGDTRFHQVVLGKI